MVDISTFKADTKAINDGVWIRVNENVYGDLEIMSRGYTDAFVDAQTQRLAKAAEEYGGDQGAIPNSVRRDINAGLLRDHLVLDVRNLTAKDQPVTVDQFLDMLADVTYARLARACWEAAARVSVRVARENQVMEGNSARPSESI